MRIETEEQGAHTVVRLHGVFALGMAGHALAETLDRLENERSGAIVADLTDLASLDSTSLGLLVGTLRRQRGLGREMMLVNPNERVAMLLRVTQLDSVFPIYSTVPEAFGALACKTGGVTDHDGRRRDGV